MDCELFVVCNRCREQVAAKIAIHCPSGRYLCQRCYKFAWREAHGNDGVLITTKLGPESN